MREFVSALKQWTGKATATVIYDSTVDEFTHDGLIEKVKGKPNIAFVGFTTKGDVFGGFYSVAVTKQGGDFFDPNIFLFSFESRGRCATPQQFAVKEGWKNKAKVEFFKMNDSRGFVYFGVYCIGGFFLGNERSYSYCKYLSDGFEGLEDFTLTGQTDTTRHYLTRLVAVQLE